MTPLYIPLACGLIAGSAIDATTGKLPNWLTVAMMAIGILLHSFSGELLLPWLGIIVAFGIHFPLWVLQVEKAGDAKFLMGIGAFIGWWEIIETSFWCACLYLPIGIVLLLIRGRFRSMFAVAKGWVWEAIQSLPEARRTMIVERFAAFRITLAPAPETDTKPTMLRTGPIIAIATVIALLTETMQNILL